MRLSGCFLLRCCSMDDVLLWYASSILQWTHTTAFSLLFNLKFSQTLEIFCCLFLLFGYCYRALPFYSSHTHAPSSKTTSLRLLPFCGRKRVVTQKIIIAKERDVSFKIERLRGREICLDYFL